mgnify:FL=1
MTRPHLNARFLTILERHNGLSQAISVPEMAEELGLGRGKGGQRLAQLVKRDLVEKGHLIGSSCGKRSGWYLIENDEEDDRTLKQYQSRFYSVSVLIKQHLANRRRRGSPQLAMF